MSDATAAPLTRPAPPLRLSLNASATAVGNVVYAGCQWALIVLLARLGEPALVGQFALGIAVSGPILLLASLQLRAVQVTDAAHSNHFSEYLALRLGTSLAALLLICGAALLIGDGTTATAVIMLVGTVRVIESLSDVYRGRMNQAERMERVAASMILRGVAAVTAFALALLLGAGLTGALVAVIATDLLVWRLWDVRNVKWLCGADRSRGLGALFGVEPRFERDTLIRLARTALPLGVVALLLSLNSYAPQYAVRLAGGEAALGIFAAVLITAMASIMLIGALGMSASPRLARLYESGDARAFRALHGRLLRFAAVVGVAGIAGAALLGRPFLHIAYGPEYAEHASLLIVLCAVAGLSHIVSVQGYAVTAARRFRPQLPVALLVAAATSICAFTLVPPYGLHGAAAAMAAGALVQGAGYTVLLRRALRQLDVTAHGASHAYA
ncbi:MAG TPA: lipopolysaccharide biosynthesis protein [Longimicrobiales bacterium]